MLPENRDKYLICVVGPTAVGKTRVSIALAKKFECEILSADSRQFYREMEIGTAKPDKTDLDMVRHHFINSLSIFDRYDAGKFEKEALELLEKIYSKRNLALMTGGSGLYVDAVLNGFDKMPEADPELRAGLNKEVEDNGTGGLLEELKDKDPVYYDEVDRHNPVRIIRAIEVIRNTGLPYSEVRKGRKNKKRPFRTIKIGLEMEREILYKRIDQRMDEMIENGLFDEARTLMKWQELNALQTVGYTEIFGFLEGEYSMDHAIHLLKRNTRRYAKRQLTWFKADEEIAWFNPDELTGIEQYVESILYA